MKLEGLVAAVHTPFASGGELDLSVVEQQAEHLLRNGVRTVFVGGTTGECHSLTVDERLALAKRWSEAFRGSNGRIVVHVGSNCLADARTLATQAQSLGTFAIAAFAPSYFKPASVETLVACCERIADAAPGLPFYFYDIPSMTGVHLSMPEFLARAAPRIPSLAGLKFTNPDLLAYQRCLYADAGRFDVPWGTDECLLAALSVGGRGGVGSSYNFAAPIYNRLIDSLALGDLEAARAEQRRSVEIIETLGRFGYMAAAKAVMEMLGMAVGSPRLPIDDLSPQRQQELRTELELLSFFESIRR